MKIIKNVNCWMVLLAVVGLNLMVACDKTTKEETPANETTTEQQTTTGDEVNAASDSMAIDENADSLAQSQETEVQGTEIEKMLGSWKTLPLTVYPEAENANILDFTKAFCKQYNRYQPNVKILKYLAAPQKFNQEAENCYFTNDVSNGFVKMTMATQYDEFTEMCYWKRPNGHALVGAYLLHEAEGDISESAFMFYDYDPATKKMTPDMEVYGVVEKAVKEGNFDDYQLRLPQKGKDIELSMYKNAGEDSYEPTEWVLKWTGNSFKLQK